MGGEGMLRTWCDVRTSLRGKGRHERDYLGALCAAHRLRLPPVLPFGEQRMEPGQTLVALWPAPPLPPPPVLPFRKQWMQPRQNFLGEQLRIVLREFLAHVAVLQQ